MNRRRALKIVTLGALAQAAKGSRPAGGLRAGFAWAPGDYQLRFFTEEENRLVDELMELLIPADSHSPGAHAARVSLFADLMISSGNREDRERWRRGLEAMRADAERSSPAQALSRAAAGEASPGIEAERFFVLLKQMTVDGYYTSEIGIHQDLNYAGNDYLSGFAGCEHPEHR